VRSFLVFIGTMGTEDIPLIFTDAVASPPGLMRAGGYTESGVFLPLYQVLLRHGVGFVVIVTAMRVQINDYKNTYAQALEYVPVDPAAERYNHLSSPAAGYGSHCRSQSASWPACGRLCVLRLQRAVQAGPHSVPGARLPVTSSGP
jgi:hypothetical protein